MPSRRIGSVIAGCRSCGVHWLVSHPQMHLLDSMLDMDTQSFDSWTQRLREDTVNDAHRQILRRLRDYLPEDSNSIFDVGAGGGGFLTAAQSAGFRPDGNDIARGAVEVTREQRGIDIRHGVLAELEDVPPQDAVTLWCVLAHVTDPDGLMADSRQLLRPGGVLYLQTPRWSFLDRVGMALHMLTRGRLTRLTDRRIALHHMVLHSRESISILLHNSGFEIESIEPRVRFSLKIDDYLMSIGVPARLARALARPFEALIDRNLFPRNVLDVFALRPVSDTVVPILPKINRGRRRIAAAAASVAIVAGGTSVAAAQNALPEPVQKAVADFTEAVLPDRFAAPRPALVADDQSTDDGTVVKTSRSANGPSEASAGATEKQPDGARGADGSSSSTDESKSSDRDGDSAPARPTVPAPNRPNAKLPGVDAPEVPDVQLPDVPDVQTPDVPDVHAPEVPSQRLMAPRVDKVEMPEVDAPDVHMPDVDVPDVKVRPELPQH